MSDPSLSKTKLKKSDKPRGQGGVARMAGRIVHSELASAGGGHGHAFASHL